jgi:hypothetical protein
VTVQNNQSWALLTERKGPRKVWMELKKGRRKTSATTMREQKRHEKTRRHSFGPNSSENMWNGFKLNFILPMGGGSVGLELGAFRPYPATLMSASGLGKISTETSSSPSSMRLPVL